MTRDKETGPEGPAPQNRYATDTEILHDVKQGMRAADARALARMLADAGVPAFPARLAWNHDKESIDKEPATRHGFKDASAEPEKVEEMFRKARLGPRQEWGVAAYPGPAGYVVLDVDVKNGGTGFEDLARLTEELGPLPRAMRVETAFGGLHLWFKRPAQPAEIRNDHLAPGIEIRCDKGYVVAPGTTSPWGDWTRDPTTRLADAEVLPDAWAPGRREKRDDEVVAASSLIQVLKQ